MDIVSTVIYTLKSDQIDHDLQWIKQLEDVITIVLTLLIFLGNFVTLLAMYRSVALRKKRYWLNCCLCFADLGGGLAGIILTFRLHGTCYSDFVATTIQGYLYSAIFTSVSHIFVMAIDRYIAIFHPLRYCSLVTKRTLVCLIIGCWSIGLLVLLSFYFGKFYNPHPCINFMLGIVPALYTRLLTYL